MPMLIPPSDKGALLGDVINEVQGQSDLLEETARQGGFTPVLDIEDATRVVSSLTLALGIVFLVTTASLYAFYYSTIFDFTGAEAKRSFSDKKDSKSSDLSFSSILEDIDASFAKWGVSGKEAEPCRKRMFCEAFLKEARKPKEKGAVKQISRLVKDALKVHHSSSGAEEVELEEHKRLEELIGAAETGLESASCEEFSTLCPNTSIHSIKDTQEK